MSKRPNCIFYDTGLLLHLLKISNTEQFLTHPEKGNIFDNLVVSELVKQMYHANNPQDIYFWRDSAGHEIDLLIDMGTRVKIVEIKAGMTIMTEMFKTLEWFETISELHNLDKTLVYCVNQAQNRNAGKVMPWISIGELLES